MSNMLQTIVPKSDQLNADDLMVGGPRTVKITGVNVNAAGGEQPVSIHFEGGAGRPFKPCKSMRRLLVQVWGADANQYVGRSMTLYCDESVTWSGKAVGGIRISHMSHLEKSETYQLTASKGKRAPYTVHPLQQPKPTNDLPSAESFAFEYDQCKTQDALDALEKKRAVSWKRWKDVDQVTIKTAVDAAKARLADQQQPAGELFDNGGTGMPPNH